MSEGISIDVGGLLPYLEDKVLALFGKDARHVAARKMLERNLRISARDATTVQIVGMDRPISIFDIYQPTRLQRRRDKRFAKFKDLIENGSDALIYGGPGRGKTMLLRYIFATMSREENVLPLLFTLRWPEAASDLDALVKAFSDSTLKLGKARVILLVDGFDEISSVVRLEVASSLRNFWSLNIGNFFLTCRSFYDIGEVSAPHWDIASFTQHDSERFIEAFGKSYGSALHAESVIADLRRHGFADFLEHPLLLALVCILKSGPMPTLPKSTIGLIRRAVDTLTFRWDEAKRLARESRYDLDGEDRMRCLLRIAFSMRNLIEPEDVVTRAAQDQLRLLQRRDVSVDRLLEELAQWYGLLVPVEDAQWSFVHRTIHDYLAARFWVETEGFDPNVVTEWNSRAAYASCLTSDATRSMVKILANSIDLGAFAECLANNAAFDVAQVAAAVVAHFHRVEDSGQVNYGEVAEISTTKAFFPLASTDFLLALLDASSPRATMANDVILWCTLVELSERGIAIPEDIGEDVILRFGEASVVAIKMNDRVHQGLVKDFIHRRSSG